MTTLHEVAQKAIYWLDQNGGAHIADELREALAQQGEQPVAWMYHDKDGFAQVLESGPHPGFDSTPLYAAAPAAQPLSDEWIHERCNRTWVFDTVKQWVREVEKAHGIGVQK